MNLSVVDLNLLLVFDAVMTERQVTRAGERIGMSQPATSNALNRLRHLLKDDLFIRGPDGMRPTPRALELAAPIRQALKQIETALNPLEFDAKNATRTFNLAMDDDIASIILPSLAKRLEEKAPGVDIRVRHNDFVNGPALLESNKIDFKICGYNPGYPEEFKSQVLFEVSYVCLMRKGHPLARPEITLEEFVAVKHLRVPITGEISGEIDRILAKQGLKRRVAMTVRHFLVVPQIIENSDMLITFPRRAAERLPGIENLHIVPLPLHFDPVQIRIIWHERYTNHTDHQWMRLELTDICRET